MSHTIIGSKIKGLRETKQISIEEMAERSGLSVEQITTIENDETLPSLGPLIKIARDAGPSTELAIPSRNMSSTVTRAVS